MIKRDKDWMIYKSLDFQKLQRIDHKKVQSIVLFNNEILCYIHKESIVKLAK
jgi:hypothetical protein